MKQRELHQAVATRTGESLREIRRRGFSIMTPAFDSEPDGEEGPQIVDWDVVEQERYRRAA